MSRVSNRINMTRGDRIFTVVNYIFLIVLSLLVLYPLIYVLSSSFSSPHAVTTGRVWLYPVEPSLVGYEHVFKNPNILQGYWNSIVLTVVGTSVNIVLTVLLAYPLSVRDFAGRKLITAVVTFTMLFNGGLVPTFILVNNLGLYNTIWALILPTCISVYNTIIAPTTCMNPPRWTGAPISAISGRSFCRFLKRFWRFWCCITRWGTGTPTSTPSST